MKSFVTYVVEGGINGTIHLYKRDGKGGYTADHDCEEEHPRVSHKKWLTKSKEQDLAGDLTGVDGPGMGEDRMDHVLNPPPNPDDPIKIMAKIQAAGKRNPSIERKKIKPSLLKRVREILKKDRGDRAAGMVRALRKDEYTPDHDGEMIGEVWRTPRDKYAPGKAQTPRDKQSKSTINKQNIPVYRPVKGKKGHHEVVGYVRRNAKSTGAAKVGGSRTAERTMKLKSPEYPGGPGWIVKESRGRRPDLRQPTTQELIQTSRKRNTDWRKDLTLKPELSRYPESAKLRRKAAIVAALRKRKETGETTEAYKNKPKKKKGKESVEIFQSQNLEIGRSPQGLGPRPKVGPTPTHVGEMTKPEEELKISKRNKRGSHKSLKRAANKAARKAGKRATKSELPGPPPDDYETIERKLGNIERRPRRR